MKQNRQIVRLLVIGPDIKLLENTSEKSSIEADAITLLLFELSTGKHNVQDICKQLQSSFPENWWQIEHDVQFAFRHLNQAKIITMDPPAEDQITIHASEQRDKPRVLYILWSYPQISETYILNEIEAMMDHYNIFVVCRYPADAPATRHVPFRIVQSSEEILAILQDFRPSVIHTHWMDNVQLISNLAKRTKTPFTVRTHSFDIEEINRNNRLAYNTDYAQAMRDLLSHELCAGVCTFPYSLPSKEEDVRFH